MDFTNGTPSVGTQKNNTNRPEEHFNTASSSSNKLRVYIRKGVDAATSGKGHLRITVFCNYTLSGNEVYLSFRILSK